MLLKNLNHLREGSLQVNRGRLLRHDVGGSQCFQRLALAQDAQNIGFGNYSHQRAIALCDWHPAELIAD